MNHLKEVTLTNVGISVGFILSPSFHKLSHLHVAWIFVQAITQHTKEGFTFSHTHTKQKQKEQLKFKTPQTVLGKPKEGEKENQQEKIEINKIFKNYRKRKQRIKNNKTNKN
jgi:hypothetical protein